MSSIYDWSTTPGSNSTVGGINTAEGMSPALVNDAIRALMAVVRQTFDPTLQNFLNASAQLPIANGGTGAATAGAALTALGGLSVNYQRLIINNKTAAFSPAVGESSNAYNYFGSPAAMTLQPNASVPIVAGDTFVIRVGSGTLTVTRGTAVNLLKNGSTTSADAVLAVGAVATLTYWGSDAWTITGSGIS